MFGDLIRRLHPRAIFEVMPEEIVEFLQSKGAPHWLLMHFAGTYLVNSLCSCRGVS